MRRFRGGKKIRGDMFIAKISLNNPQTPEGLPDCGGRQGDIFDPVFALIVFKYFSGENCFSIVL